MLMFGLYDSRVCSALLYPIIVGATLSHGSEDVDSSPVL